MRVTVERVNELIEKSGVNDLRGGIGVRATREGDDEGHVRITAANYKARVLLECQAQYQIEKIKALLRFAT